MVVLCVCWSLAGKKIQTTITRSTAHTKEGRQKNAPVEVGEAADGRDHVHGLVHHRHGRRAQRRA